MGAVSLNGALTRSTTCRRTGYRRPIITASGSRLSEADRRELVQERVLLRNLIALSGRFPDEPPPDLVDAVLLGRQPGRAIGIAARAGRHERPAPRRPL